jgi:hypothetical protein
LPEEIGAPGADGSAADDNRVGRSWNGGKHWHGLDAGID